MQLGEGLAHDQHGRPVFFRERRRELIRAAEGEEERSEDSDKFSDLLGHLRLSRLAGNNYNTQRIRNYKKIRAG